MVNIFEVTIESNNDKVVIKDIYLEDSEGDTDTAVSLAIELLEGDSILQDGYIAYVSNQHT